ncbi:hypothetical protein JY651_41190 [Pyxidicoccus parkwayensis]|uniref:Lipoprotein n=1 Tax=Pyxidicoccus parkwayensis TaxID=2813578 RepID=A0ABX7NZN8_9BACT|nr:hypothetical protein [Pyxidicoccus parkwaysis]QSQ21533.1 hypothetical protein JY651_41190 [Pyxidicoccus parkwaysis]
MHKRFAVVAVVAVVWGLACVKRSTGSEGGEPETVTMESPGAGAPSALDCSNELTIDVDPDGADDSSGKRFNPRPSPQWTLCTSGALKVQNDLTYALCLSIVDSRGHNAITPVNLPVSPNKQDIPLPSAGTGYTLGVCKQSGADCSSGCGHMMDVHDTIKGNLSVVTSG